MAPFIFSFAESTSLQARPRICLTVTGVFTAMIRVGHFEPRPASSQFRRLNGPYVASVRIDRRCSFLKARSFPPTTVPVSSPPTFPMEAEQLLALISSSTHTIIRAYEDSGRPTPDLNATHKSTEALLTPVTRNATRVLEGACAQLCALLAHPAMMMLNRSNGVRLRIYPRP